MSSSSQHLIDQYVEAYKPKIPFYTTIASLVAARCRTALDTAHIPALITSRAKQPAQLAAKLYKRNSFRHYAVAADMHVDAMDLAGVRIALYFAGHEKAVLKLLMAAMVVHDVKVHGDISLLNEHEHEHGVVVENRASGYRAIHLHVKLGTALAEVQVTSLAMHIWSEVEHRLVYKAEYGEATALELRILQDIHASIEAAEASLYRLKTALETRCKL